MPVWFVARWAKIASPSWVAPLFASSAGLLCLLIILLEVKAWHPLPLILVGVVVGGWLLETSGVRWPRWLFLILVLFPPSVLILLGQGETFDTVAPLLLLLAVGWAAYTGTHPQRLLALALTLVSIAMPFLSTYADYDNWIVWSIAAVALWATGSALASQQRLIRELRTAQADLSRQAAAEERRRIAREVHDVVAHSLAVTLLHVTGARRLLARDPQRATDALMQAEALGRQSMADIRRTVGLLTSAGDNTPTTPLPGVPEMDNLVAEFAGAGLAVTYQALGDLNRIPSVTGLDLYRITQEALTNSSKHAPGARVMVTLTVNGHDVTLCVEDTGTPPGSPPADRQASARLGIPGMCERAALLGGTLTAEPYAAGWQVLCCIPLPTPPVQATGNRSNDQ